MQTNVRTSQGMNIIKLRYNMNDKFIKPLKQKRRIATPLYILEKLVLIEALIFETRIERLGKHMEIDTRKEVLSICEFEGCLQIRH